MSRTIDLEIAHAAKLRPIEEIAEKLGISAASLYRHGPYKAKVDVAALSPHANKKGKLVLVTAINPTAAGEGKTTTTIGLGDALSRLQKKVVVALREPSLGPCFGLKGGATGGGYAQVAPMEDINLHFTGDFHAITSAHNLCAAMLDNHLYWGNALGIDTGRIMWRRVMDMNDRALRKIRVGLEGKGPPRDDGFDITVASEVMAIFCLAKNAADLKARLDKIVIAEKADGTLIRAADIKATGAMAALLKDALMPNLVQTLEGTPALIHGGPFANIAHGCNSVVATNAALALGDIVVTEAGFGADLGAEKFLNIKCRQAGLTPDAVVVVATVRALKLHGGVDKADLATENLPALARGMENLLQHIDNIKAFGLPVVVAINRFNSDTPAELKQVEESCKAAGAEAHLCTHWADGGRGAENLAQAVLNACESGAEFKTIYADELSLTEKIRVIAKKIYRAKDIEVSALAAEKLARYEAQGFGRLQICMAKTQYSFSTDPTKMGAPRDFILPVRDVRLSAGAGFVVALTGDIMTMPGLPRVPAAESIGLNAHGQIEGLF